MSGSVQSGVFSPEAAEPAGSKSADPLPALPLDAPLLKDFSPRVFGGEERAQAQTMEHDELEITCRAGQAPAGVALTIKHARLPARAQGHLRIRARGDAGFALGIAAGDGEPQLLQPIPPVRDPASDEAQRQRPAAPARGAAGDETRWRSSAARPDGDDAQVQIPLDRMRSVLNGQAGSLVIVCPTQNATLRVMSIDIAPAGASTGPTRAAWVWQPARWTDTPASLLREAGKQSIDRIYISAPIREGAISEADAAALAKFISQARQQGIAIWTVEGDPAMATPEGRDHALLRLAAIREYQRAAQADARLAGVQYDIEPYLLPAYRADPAAVAAQWAQTLHALAALQHGKQEANAGMKNEGRAAREQDASADSKRGAKPRADAATQPDTPLDMVLPFWLPGSPMASIVLPALAKTAGSVTIMAYRTRTDAVQQIAEPLLAWGSAQGIPVHVALEAGPLPDELTLNYTPAPAGSPAHLWLLPDNGDTLAVQFSEPVLLEQGRGYTEGWRTPAPAAAVSFLGDHAAMRKAADQLQPALRAWPAYAGMAFHGLLE